jgi:aryl-alcohol dehydrogenase-like predicted oxidoreductase
MTRLGSSDIDVFGLCLGGNVFGWTADEAASFAVLDGYTAAGGNFIDTADNYSQFVPGNRGGESETIIGNWMAKRGSREHVIVASKVGKGNDHPGLAPANIRAAIDDTLRRLQTDYVDLYYAHLDDEETPLDESLGTFDELVKEGKVRTIGLSNYSAARLEEALGVCDANGLVRPVALQPEYSLVEREEFEEGPQQICERENIACLPYWSLASGFLTGKYRPGVSVDSPRAGKAGGYLEDNRAAGLLAALDDAAGEHATPVASVALAWLRAQPSVVAPIASARSAEQLDDLLPGASLELSDGEVDRLTAAWA